MIITALEKIEKEMAEIKLRLVELESLKKENEYLRELVRHLASRPAPYQTDPFAPPYKVTCG
jgi:cell shape-determining protein MreC